MTSERETKHCFVYITLPDETEAVTAARFELTTNRRGDALGRLVYGRSYLGLPNVVEIDPVELKLGAQQYETALFGGVFGALRDATPDYWGRLIIQRAMAPLIPYDMDYLLQSADDRAGALGFGRHEHPPAPKRDFNKTLNLKSLQETAMAVLADSQKLQGPEAEQVRRLVLFGTSMGGARPKAVVEDRYGLWIAKFQRPEDRWNYARVENAMLRLARQCGLNVAESKVTSVAGKDVLLVKRFDRDKTQNGYRRARMISALTLLRTDDSDEGRARWSYPALAEELRRVCRDPRGNAQELFRRMCFNALISNTDDHPRNHAAIAKGRHWELSPAYDLTPAPSHSMERNLAMDAGDWGRAATAQNLLSQCGRFLLRREEAQAIIGAMQAQIASDWYGVACKAKVTQRDCATLKPAFENEGFSFRAAT